MRGRVEYRAQKFVGDGPIQSWSRRLITDPGLSNCFGYGNDWTIIDELFILAQEIMDD